jgi:hypothetical protein
MTASNRWSLTIMLGVGIVASSPNAAAYTYLYTCNGCPASVGTATITLKRHHPSLPTGAAATNDLLNAETEWSSTSAVRMAPWTPVNLNGTMAGSSVPHGDGQWETALVPRSAIGANGKTIYSAGVCGFGCNYIDEADLLVASDMPFGNPDESGWDAFVNGQDSGRATFLHEWGHMLGLNHTSTFSCVGSGHEQGQPYPRVGGTGTHVTTFGDDRSGIGNAYALPASYKNLAASAQKVVGGVVQSTTFLGTLVVATGTTVPMSFTAVNTSTQALTFSQMVLLRTSPASYTGGIIAKSVEGSQVGQRNQVTFDAPFLAPAIPCGQYHWVYHHVDSENAHAEARETDNGTHHTVTLWRNCP